MFALLRFVPSPVRRGLFKVVYKKEPVPNASCFFRCSRTSVRRAEIQRVIMSPVRQMRWSGFCHAPVALCSAETLRSRILLFVCHPPPLAFSEPNFLHPRSQSHSRLLSLSLLSVAVKGKTA